MKRILVTGGAGFIGSNLCERLLKDGDCRVTALDNLSTGKLSNLSECLKNPLFEFIEGDVTTPHDIPCDRIYNAACPASPPAYQKSPTHTTKTCVVGAVNMLELATRYNAVMMQFSTSEVYGDPQVHPQTESYRGSVNPNGIRSCYDEGKRCAESLCFDYNREFGTKIKVIRIFNTYGPKMDPDDGRVVSNFIVQALRGEPLTVYGSGSQTRSFQYVDDLIEGIVRMMEKSRPDFMGPVNLGNPEEFTVAELAEKVMAKIGGVGVVYKPLPGDDPTRRRADIALAGRELGGWKPCVHLNEGLDKTIEYFRKIIK